MAEIELDIDTNAKAVSKDMKNLSNNTKKSATSFNTLSSNVVKSAGAFFGAQGLISGVKKIINEFDQASQKARSFTDAITGLVALGGDIDEIKESVNRISIETGVGARDVANAMFQIKSGAADASQTIKDELLRNSINLSKVWGVDLATSSDALTTLFNIYGKEVGSVTDLTNKLNFASVEGKTNFQEIGTLLPTVASAAKAFGVDFDDLVSIIIEATKKGGNASVTFTGIRNSLAALEEAQKKGIKTSGTLAQRFVQLKNAGVPLLEIFGREGLATGQSIIEAAASGRLESLSAQSKSIKGDAVRDRFNQRIQQDQQFRLAEDLKKTQAKRDAAQSSKTLGTEIDIGQERLGTFLEERGGGSATLGGVRELAGKGLPGGVFVESLVSLFSRSEKQSSQQVQTSVNQVKVANANRGEQ